MFCPHWESNSGSRDRSVTSKGYATSSHSSATTRYPNHWMMWAKSHREYYDIYLVNQCRWSLTITMTMTKNKDWITWEWKWLRMIVDHCLQISNRRAYSFSLLIDIDININDNRYILCIHSQLHLHLHLRFHSLNAKLRPQRLTTLILNPIGVESIRNHLHYSKGYSDTRSGLVRSGEVWSDLSIGSKRFTDESRVKVQNVLPTLRIELRFKGSFSHKQRLRDIESFLGHNEIS